MPASEITDRSSPQSPPPPVVPDYELLRRIGSGAYGEVWLGRSTATGALRAVKFVHRATFTDARPFEREFAGIRKFEQVSRSHSSQVALFHVGRAADDSHFYYVMELADGVRSQRSAAASRKPEAGSQRQEVKGRKDAWEDALPPLLNADTQLLAPDSYQPYTLRCDLEHGRLPAARVLELGLALAEALAHLHANGLVHRDIKPSNIIFVDGRPKLADIGLVTDASDQCSIVGTEGYLPPEGPGMPQADIFALGTVLYEALTGLDRRQFPELPADLRQWPDAALAFELNTIVVRACAADAHERYTSAEAMLADLRHLAAGRSVKRRRAFAQSRRLVLHAGLVAVLWALAWMAVAILRTPPPGSDTAAELLRTGGTTNQEAYNAHRMGRFYYAKQNQQKLRLAAEYFQKAIELDSNYVSAYVGLVDTYNSDFNFVPSLFVPKVRALGEKLVAIAPERAEGYMTLGHCKFHEWQWAEAERLFRKAIRLNDEYLMAHFELAWLLLIQCRFSEAEPELRRGEQIDPTSLDIHLGMAWLDLGQRKFEAAIRRLRRAQEMEPSSDLPASWLVWTYEANGDFANAIAYGERTELMWGEQPQKVAAHVEAIRAAFLELGAQGYWRTKAAYLKTVRRTVLDEVAGCHAKIGETDQALTLLERMVNEHHSNVIWLLHRSRWDFANLQSEARFLALLKRVGLD